MVSAESIKLLSTASTKVFDSLVFKRTTGSTTLTLKDEAHLGLLTVHNLFAEFCHFLGGLFEDLLDVGASPAGRHAQNLEALTFVPNVVTSACRGNLCFRAESRIQARTFEGSS